MHRDRLPRMPRVVTVPAAMALLLLGPATSSESAWASRTAVAAAGAYEQVGTWNDVGRAARIVAGADGKVYVLNEAGVRRTAPDGQLQREIPAVGLLEIAVDPAGRVYGARAKSVQSIADSGALNWTEPIVGDFTSLGEVPPYLAALTWNEALREPFLLLETREVETLRFRAGNGDSRRGFDLAFPTHVYWDMEFATGRAYVLNRTLQHIEVYDGGTWSRTVPMSARLPVRMERLAVGPDGSIFGLTGRRTVVRLDAAGNVLDAWDATNPEPGRTVSAATDVAVDREGRVYVTDPALGEVRVYARNPDLTPGLPPAPEPDPDRCHVVTDKFAEPTFLLLGERTQVTLRLDGDCPARAEVGDIVLVLDRSNSMNKVDASGRQKMAAARQAALEFTEQIDFQANQVGLVVFEAFPELLVPLTHDKQLIQRRIADIRADGATDIAAAIQMAARELSGERRRPEAKPIVVLLTDGNPFNSTRLATVAAGDEARYAGMTVYTIGLGDDVDPGLLRVVAQSPKHYYFAPTADSLDEIYRQIAKKISASVLLKTVKIVDRVPDFMEYVDDGSTSPPAEWDAVRRTLTWAFSAVPFDGLQMTYWLRPKQVGEWPTNISADYDGSDGLDQPQSGPFPIPRVVVVAPTATPSITPTNKPTSTGTRSPTFTATNTPTPSNTPTATATFTPSPTATPSSHTIYLMIVFNAKCFQLYGDIALVIDASTTMDFITPDGKVKLDAAKTAAGDFLAQMQLAPDMLGRHDQAAIVWFNDTAQTEQRLTNDREALEDAIQRIDTAEGTRIDLGIQQAHAELLIGSRSRRKRANAPAIVLLSDGIPNRVSIGEVVAAADEAVKDGIEVYTVGFGELINEANLRRIASENDMYYYAPTAADLSRIYQQIAGELLCR